MTLAWDASTTVGIAGYRLYTGGVSHVYTNLAEVGTATSASLDGLTPGVTYYFAVSAYDGSGLEGAPSDELSYTVPSAVAPAVVLGAPANGATYDPPAVIGLAATVTPNGHTITTVQFFSANALLGEDTTAPYAYAWTNLNAGVYALTARVTYDGSATVTSAPVTVTVSSPPTGGTMLAADSGTIIAPFVTNAGVLSQPVTTGLTNGGRATYTFTIPASADYFVAARVSAPDTNANSYYVNIDAEPTDPAMIWDIPVAAGFVSRTVSWRGNGTETAGQFSPKRFNLAAGTHQLIMRGREANTQLGTITIAPTVLLPAPWETVDIGRPGLTGDASVAGGLLSASGSGSLGAKADSFRFLYQPMSGNGEIRAQVRSFGGTAVDGRAGVMIRESLAPGSRYAYAGYCGDGKVRWQRRSSTGGNSSSTAAGTATPPNLWVRLVRTNNTFTGYKSTDATNWTKVTSASITMAANVYFGIAVASGATNSTSTGSFGNTTMQP